MKRKKVKVRRTWEIKPTQRIKPSGKLYKRLSKLSNLLHYLDI